jgi:hypothetical protein
MNALTEIGGTALEHPPYSPDLTPCYFWVFPRQETACSILLVNLAANGLQHDFEK